LAGIETIEEFVQDATRAQAAGFGASCAERAVSILFWVVSEDGRTSDLEAYTGALETLWKYSEVAASELRERQVGIMKLRELTVGDDVSGARAFAYQGAVTLYTALEVCAGGDAIRDCSSTLRNFSFRLGRRCGVELLPGEDQVQYQDATDLISDSADQPELMGRLRERSAAIGRSWLALAVQHLG
jgi:hypothetical protein